MTAIPIDIDWETLIRLLNRFREGILTREDAPHLEYLLKKYYKKAMLKGDSLLANRLSYILIGLVVATVIFQGTMAMAVTFQ